MPVIKISECRGATKEQYERTVALIEEQQKQPAGLLFHAATFTADGARIVDIWASEQAWEAFLEKRLAPAAARAGHPIEAQRGSPARFTTSSRLR